LLAPIAYPIGPGDVTLLNCFFCSPSCGRIPAFGLDTAPQRVWLALVLVFVLVLVLVLVLVIEKSRKTEQENKKEPDPAFSKHALLAPVTSGTPFVGTNPTHAVV